MPRRTSEYHSSSYNGLHMRAGRAAEDPVKMTMDAMLGRLAKHPYAAIRENVARHPNADPDTLAWLSRDHSQPLWYLVAFNPNAPAALRKKLQERMRRLGEKSATQ